MEKKKKNQSRYPGPRWARKKKKSEQVSEALMGKKIKKKIKIKITGIRGPDGPKANSKTKKLKNRYPLPRWARIWGAKGGTAGIRGPDGLRKKKN